MSSEAAKPASPQAESTQPLSSQSQSQSQLQSQSQPASQSQTDGPSNNTNTDEAEVEADVDAEMVDVQEPSNTQSHSQTQDVPSTMDTDTAEPAPVSLPSRKDITLRDFLSKMDDYAPIIPDAVTAHYLTLAGLPPPSATDPSGERGLSTPLPLARLLALATQKFVADVAADAYQYSRIRANNSAGAAAPVPTGPTQQPGKGQAALGVQRAGYGGGGQGGSAQGKTALTMEDLGMAVQEYGINVKRGEFYR